MTNVLSILGEEGDLTTATTVDAAKVVRLLTTTTTVKILIKRDSVTIGSFTCGHVTGGTVTYITKEKDDVIEAVSGGSTMLVTKIAYSH
jgi:hypothetical protein